MKVEVFTEKMTSVNLEDDFVFNSFSDSYNTYFNHLDSTYSSATL